MRLAPCCTIIGTLVAGTLLAGIVSSTKAAHAGPPLLSDDPHTVGPGRVEAILAGSGFFHEGSADVLAPVVDLTLGVVEGVDIGVVASPIFSIVRDAPNETKGFVSLSVKWQPLRGEHWNAAFTPSVALNAPIIGDTNFVLPVQIEYGWERFSLGVDAGYIVDLDDSDLWIAALYGGWAPSDSLTWLVEVWAGQRTETKRLATGLTLGVDWVMPGGLHLLAGAGPGFNHSGTRNVRVDAYLGLQWDFALWPAR
jgi:hypothetical protein